jgi:hypothetical protein
MLTPASVPLSLNPLPDIRWTIFELDPIGFTARQKFNRSPINERYVLQAQRQVPIRRLSFQRQKPPQLCQIFHFNPAAQDEDNFRVSRPLDFQHDLKGAIKKPLVIA